MNVLREDHDEVIGGNLVIPTDGNIWKSKKKKGDLSHQESVQLREDLQDCANDDDTQKYDASDFAKGMLRGMGWKEGEKYGRSDRLVQPLILKSMPKLAGLGSSIPSETGFSKRKEAENSLEKKLLKFPVRMVDIDSIVTVVDGPYEGLFGRVLSISKDKLQVRLGDLRVVRVPIEDAKHVDIDKLNDGHPIRVFCRQEESSVPVETKPIIHKVEKHEKVKITWIIPNLRVRLIAKQFGKYYKQKGIVIDVPSRDHCSLRMDDGKYFDDVYESMVETVIPLRDEEVYVVAGKFKGKIGILRDKNNESSKCVVDFDGDVHSISYDDVCMYISS